MIATAPTAGIVRPMEANAEPSADDAAREAFASAEAEHRAAHEEWKTRWTAWLGTVDATTREHFEQRLRALGNDIQGAGGIWLAGAWGSYGFHEDGLKSALRVVNGLGVRAPWQGEAVPASRELEEA